MTEMTKPRDLFIHGLKDIYYAEKTIVKKLPGMIEEATDEELMDGLRKHLEQTKGQVENLEQVFEEFGEKAAGEKCPGIEGLVAEHDEFVEKEQPTPEILDTFLTGAAARVEHYEIAAYRGLVESAKAMGKDSAARLLEENLAQEQEALELVEAVSTRLIETQAREVTA
jgi:ferritin-like metal-binding protein YciE